MSEFRKSRWFAAILNILMPGLGHAFWKEITFGLFVFLIMLSAMILYIVTFFVAVPLVARLVIYSLPLIFYLFTFVDLFKIVKSKKLSILFSKRHFTIYLIVGASYQVMSPLAPTNFGWRNCPEIFTIDTSSLSPFFSEGDLVKSSSLAYKIDFYFLTGPIFHDLPERWDVLRVVDNSGKRHSVIALGLPGENIEIFENDLYVEGAPELLGNRPVVSFLRDWPLTSVSSYSILVATLRLGAVDKIYELPLENIAGKVTNIW